MTKKISLKKIIILVITLTFLIGVIYSYNFLDEIVTSYFKPDGDKKCHEFDGFNDADYFIKFGHGEIKSLATQFLTLLSAILVFSVTYSEKVIIYSEAGKPVRAVITSTWIFLVLAIVLDGIGLVLNAFTLPFALSDVESLKKTGCETYEFYEHAFHALYSMVMSGFFFVIALVGIVVSGIMKLGAAKGEPNKTPIMENSV